jgi:hypothetical protein
MKKAIGFIICSVLIVGGGCFRSSEAPKNTDLGSTGSVDELPFKSVNDYIPSDQEPQEATEALPQALQEEVIKVGERVSASKNVVVSSLVENQELGNPFIILGRARAFENVIDWRVKDSKGKTLAQGSSMTNAQEPSYFGSFRVRAFLNEIPDADDGVVQVYTSSPKDGSEQDMVEVPVRFLKDRSAVKVYFSNLLKDPNVEHCDVTYPITRRIIKTQNTAEAALLELIKGPTLQEQSSGSRTTIVPGTVLRSVKIVDGVATADFSDELVYGIGGSCRVQALISQITQTLKQFEGVETIKIFVEGKDADLQLQP